MSFLAHLSVPAGLSLPEMLRLLVCTDLPIERALPTVNPGDDDEDDDEDTGNIEPEEDEGQDDDEEDDEDDPLWAAVSTPQPASVGLLRRSIPVIRRPSHSRHTAPPASGAPF